MDRVPRVVRQLLQLSVWLLRTCAPLVVVVLIIGLYDAVWVADRSFFTGFRLSLIAKQTAIVGMGALGMTVIIISGGIDLSVGSMLALLSVLLAVLLRNENLNVAPWILFCVVLIAGIGVGTINGLLVAGLRLVPFLATLGKMMVFRGLAGWLADQQKVVVPAERAPAWLTSLLDPPPPDSWQLVCRGVWLVVLMGGIVAAVLRFTSFGRYVFALGSNEQAAQLCGIRVARMKVAIYALGGFFMAIAAAFAFSNLNSQGDPTAGVALELEIIAAVVIGGGSLSGGRGSVLGSLVGAVTMTMLRSGCVFAGISDSVQRIVIGAIIVAAVALDQALHRQR